MLTAIRVRDLKSFEDSGWIELKPLTLFLGINSSGKSSLLRLMPLLRQSVAAPTRGPILWYGQYVDYGDFKDVHRSGAQHNTLSLDFRFRTPVFHGHRSPFSPFYGGIIAQGLDLELQLVLAGRPGPTTQVVGCTVRCAGSALVIEYDSNLRATSISVDGTEFLDQLDPRPELVQMPQSIVPFLGATIGKRRQPYAPSLKRPFLDALAPYHHGRVSKQRQVEIATYLEFGAPETLKASLMRHGGKFLQKKIRRLQVDGAEFKNIWRRFFLASISSLLSISDEMLNEFGSGVVYTKPFREPPKRYYRHQELAVDEIEPAGANLAMFLRSLSSDQRLKFSAWVTEYLGIGVRTDSEGGHVGVSLVDTAGREFNLADMGFGYSQVLPVLAQMWIARTTPPRRRRRTCVAIEQPELHLHPQHQARLGDLLADGAAALSGRGNIMVETHSESLVSRLGELVESGHALSPDDISVLLVERDQASGISHVRKATFDSGGMLHNWPIGFFNA